MFSKSASASTLASKLVIWIEEHQEDPILVLLIRFDVEVEEAKQQVLRRSCFLIAGIGLLAAGIGGPDVG